MPCKQCIQLKQKIKTLQHKIKTLQQKKTTKFSTKTKQTNKFDLKYILSCHFC